MRFYYLERPFSASIFLIAPTLPSIISEGATISAPHSANASACLANKGRLETLSIVPSDKNNSFFYKKIRIEMFTFVKNSTMSMGSIWA